MIKSKRFKAMNYKIQIPNDNKKNFFIGSFIISMLLITTCLLGIIPLNNITKAVPVVDYDSLRGSWNDTFNDTTGIILNNNIVVDEVEEIATLDLFGYFSNFDNEPYGYIKNWTYEYSSNKMAHTIRDDLYDLGKDLFLARNDDGSKFASHVLYKDFNNSYYPILEFDLIPWEIKGPNRQAYFYIEFYDKDISKIHEVRYYWDDTRSGTPANTTLLTAVDLNWNIKEGSGNFGGNNYELRKNISLDINANPNVDLTKLIQNSTKTRYGFYQDAGKNMFNWDQVIIDNLTIRKVSSKGSITSVKIVPHNLGEWGALTLSKTENKPNDYITVTVLDTLSGQPIIGFENLTGNKIDLSSIDANKIRSIILKAYFFGKDSEPILYDWQVDWKLNQNPTVDSFICHLDASKELYRTRTANITATGLDVESQPSKLIPTIEYRIPGGFDWETDYLSGTKYSQDQWNINFTPSADAVLGPYDFRVQFEDPFGGISEWRNIDDGIIVKNNIPTSPSIEIEPLYPTTLEDLRVSITIPSFDVENEPITYTFKWYMNGDWQYELTFESMVELSNNVSFNNTKKNEVWKCIVIPNDGNDEGPSDSAQVIIQNSPPDLVKHFDKIVMDEDSILILENKLTEIFSDVDEDELQFFSEGEDNLVVEITQENGTISFSPEENWFGTEYITFYANDSLSDSVKETVEVTVLPTNDLPRIVKVGDKDTSENYPVLDFFVDQDESLNLTIIVEDIDGDVERRMISYHLNLSGLNNITFNMFEKKIVLNPDNNDVGWYFVNISISDNNETPLEFVTQHIRIQVRNINDPPTVEILKPSDNQEFLETENITFECISNDIDLSIRHSKERLTYHWYSTQPKHIEFGVTREITGIKLEPGQYNITVEVVDSSNVSATDHINIVVLEVKEIIPQTPQQQLASSSYLWLILLLILIVIIVVVVILFMLLRRKKKKDKEGEEESKEIQPKTDVRAPQIAQPPQPQPISAVAPPTQINGTQPAQIPPGAPPGAAQPKMIQVPPPVPQQVYVFRDQQVVVQEKTEVKEAKPVEKQEPKKVEDQEEPKDEELIGM
jgi:hypothetical protein